MAKLHELLAIEKTVVGTAGQIHKDTAAKFHKDQFFTGHTVTLKMLTESPENAAIEQAARDVKELPTTVVETLDYHLQKWAAAEDVLFQKNATNTKAIADVILDGKIFLTGLPVDELMGLEARLERFRNEVAVVMPTLDAGKKWTRDQTDRKGAWRSAIENTSKTAKIMYPVVLAPATDKHPAQVKEATRDEVVGTFSRTILSGSATTLQKSVLLERIEALIAAVKQARQRANSIEARTETIGADIAKYLMGAFE